MNSNGRAPNSPYKGLVPYTEEDALFFCGRDQQREILIANLRAARLTVLYGESGAGKSSLLRAGVLATLREAARADRYAYGQPGPVAVYFNEWRQSPTQGLCEAINRALAQVLDEDPAPVTTDQQPLAEVLHHAAKRAGGPLLIILDQFEEYFLYHPPPTTAVYVPQPTSAVADAHAEQFAAELPSLVADRTLKANFLIAIRADAHEKLEHFKPQLPHIFANSIRLGHLNEIAARRAIEEPLQRYNRFFAAGRHRVDLADGLAEEVLRQLTGAPLPFDAEPLAAPEPPGDAAQIKTPLLQMVMTRLWNEDANGAQLRRETLARLGGVRGIAGAHLEEALKELAPDERQLAARLFRYLVTPTGTRYAYAVDDLAGYLQTDAKPIAALLEKLSGSGKRILSPVAPLQGAAAVRYEIAHDVLGPAVRAYAQKEAQEEAARQAAQAEEARAAKLLRRLAAALAVMLLVATGLAWYAYRQRNQANVARARVEQANVRERALRQAAEATINQIIPALYEALYKDNDFAGSRQRLEQLRDYFRRQGQPIGAGVALASLGDLYYRAEQYAQAVEQYRAALRQLEKQTPLPPDHPYIISTRNKLANALLRQGQTTEAEAELQRALGLLQQSAGAESEEAALSLKYLGQTYIAQSRYDEAGEVLQQALAITEKIFGVEHQQTALALSELAGLRLRQGRYDEARQLYERAQSLLEKTLGPNDAALASVLSNLASANRQLGRYTVAESLFRRALAIHRQQLDAHSLVIASDLNNLALLYNEQERYEDALRLFNEALPIYEGTLGREHPRVARVLANLALTRQRQRDFVQAEALLKEALAIQRQQPNYADLAASLNTLAACYREQGRSAEAERLYQEALDLRRTHLGTAHPDVADSLIGLAMLYARWNRAAEAESFFRQGLQLQEQTLGVNHPRLIATLTSFAALLRQTNKGTEAADLERRATAIRARAAQ